MCDLCLKVNPDDNVAVAVVPLRAGKRLNVDGWDIILPRDIPAGQKIALLNLEAGDYIIKYGCPIGYVTDYIDRGEWINEKNARICPTGIQDTRKTHQVDLASLWNQDICKGYLRKSGEAGVRNDVWISAASENVTSLVYELTDSLRLTMDGNGINFIVPFPYNKALFSHPEQNSYSYKILKDLVCHPNAGGVLVIASENDFDKIESFKIFLGKYDSGRIRFILVKDNETGQKSCMKLLKELYIRASKNEVTEIPLSKLRLD